MTVKQQIFSDIKNIANQNLLNQVYDFLQLLKKNAPEKKSNIDAILKVSGKISEEDASDMEALIEQEFNKIEGEWL